LQRFVFNMHLRSDEKQGLVLAVKDHVVSCWDDKEHADQHKCHLSENPSLTTTAVALFLFILTGCIQPLLMTLIRTAGLADPSCQLYMMFYYFGPASAIFLIWRQEDIVWPSKHTISKACGIALWDISAQTLNYTGASLAGPAIFAIVYSSVTIWAALFSQIFLARRMNIFQWMAVILVFAGLAITAVDSAELGKGVIHGAIMVFLGSLMHGLFYVMSEAVMTKGEERLAVEQNCAVQGLTASVLFLLWQMVYTLPNAHKKLWIPMEHAGTSHGTALGLLSLFAVNSFLHSITFYYTLRHVSGGATSAGIVKGLQAVLLFVVADWMYCGRIGGKEMCFSTLKLISLITVASGVLGYGYATNNEHAKHGSRGHWAGYDQVGDGRVIEIEPI
jgi:drug/metabolite transporter (DMT)-like permease